MKTVRHSLVAGTLLAALFLTAGAPVHASDTKLININTAAAGELADLKGIGDAKAQAIVDYRDKNGPFKSVEDLRHVKGIGEHMLDRLRPQITIDQPASPAAAAAPMAAKQ